MTKATREQIYTIQTYNIPGISDAQTKFQKTQTCSNLLSKFLYLDENSRQNDAAVDQ